MAKLADIERRQCDRCGWPGEPLAKQVGPGLARVVGWRSVHWGPNPESSNPMIGIWLKRTARGHRVGAIAQRLVADKLFTETETNRVEAHTDVANLAEQRALERAGFTR